MASQVYAERGRQHLSERSVNFYDRFERHRALHQKSEVVQDLKVKLLQPNKKFKSKRGCWRHYRREVVKCRSAVRRDVLEKDRREGREVVGVGPAVDGHDKEQREYKKVYVITDSIGKDIHGIRECRVVAYPGARINDIRKKVANKDVCLVGVDVVIFHVGTNNIADGLKNSKTCDIMADYSSLVQDTERMYKHTGLKIIISAIIPRLKDHTLSDPLIREINFSLKHMSKTRFSFICIFRPFVKFGQPRQELYANDGLHLSREGTKCMDFFFIRVISTLK